MKFATKLTKFWGKITNYNKNTKIKIKLQLITTYYDKVQQILTVFETVHLLCKGPSSLFFG